MTTNFAKGSHVGIDLEATPTDAEHTLGFVVDGNDNTRWVYVQASGAINQYDFVTLDENFQATALADAGGAAGHVLGVAQVAFADNDYGFVAIEGTNIKGNFKASCAADNESLYTNTTSGHLDDASTADAILVVGVVAVVAPGAADTNKEIIMRSPRFQS